MHVGEKCKLGKLDNAIALGASLFPVDFGSVIQSIHSMSDQIAAGPTNLFSGPQTINCTKPYERTDCFNVKEAYIESSHVKPAEDNLLVLSKAPLQFVYNYFTVDMKHWFYNTKVFDTIQELKVEAEGFVVVNVIDKVEIKDSTNGKYTITWA